MYSLLASRNARISPILAIFVSLGVATIIYAVISTQRSPGESPPSKPHATEPSSKAPDPESVGLLHPDSPDSVTPQHTLANSSFTVRPALVLPETSPPALRQFLDPEHAERLPLSFPTEVHAVEHPDEIAAVVALVHDREETDAVRHQGIELLKRSRYDQLTDVLLQRLADAQDNPRFRAFVVQHLGSELADAAPEDYQRRTDALQACLTHEEPRVRREALGALVRIRHAQAVALATDTGWEDPLWQPHRDALIDAAVVLRDRSVLPRLRPLLLNADTELRIAALAAVGEFRDLESRALVDEATRSPVPRVQRAATLALQRLTPDAAPPDLAPSLSTPSTATPAPALDPSATTTPE